MRIAFSLQHNVVLALLSLLAAGCSSPSSSPSEPLALAGSVPQASKEQALAIGRLARDTSAKWRYSVQPSTGTISHLAGRSTPLMTVGVSGKDATLEFVGRYRELYKIGNPARELSLVHEHHDTNAFTHVRLKQMVGAVPVHGGEMIAHYDPEGALTSIDAHYVPGLDAIDQTPAITPEEAYAKAKGELTASTPTEDEALLSLEAAPLLTVFTQDQGPSRLAYELRVRGKASRPVRMAYMIDAHTGEVLEKYSDLQTATGSGTGVLGDTKSLQVREKNGKFELADNTRTPNGIFTATAGNTETIPGTLVSSSTSTSFDATGPAKGAAVDAHFYTGVVYDYYKKNHGRSSIDGRDGELVSTVHFDVDLANASWDGTQMMYGDGDRKEFRPMSAALDIVAHELTHGVTQYTSGLKYIASPGALNEAVSDIFGELVEHSLKPDATRNWLEGEDCVLKPNTGLRSFIHPSQGLDAQPTHYSQYVITLQDSVGVHLNSGIVNNAAFLMTMGGTNDTSKIVVPAGIGWEKLGKLWYAANSEYFGILTGFQGAAEATLAAAQDLKFTKTEQDIIECAWIAVGVLDGKCANIAPSTPQAPADGGTDGSVASADGGAPSSVDGGAGLPSGSPSPGAGDAGGSAPYTPAPGTPEETPSEEDPEAGPSCSAARGEPGNGGVGLLFLAGALGMLRRRRAGKKA